MTKYLVELKDSTTDDMVLMQLHAGSVDEVRE